MSNQTEQIKVIVAHMAEMLEGAPKFIVTHNDAEEWAKALLIKAKKMKDAIGEVPAALFGTAYKNDGVFISPTTIIDDRSNEIITLLIPRFIQETKASAVALITEGWKNDPVTHQHVGELISALVATPERLSSIVIEFTKEGGHYIYQEPVTMTEGSSRFFPDDMSTLPWHELTDSHSTVTH